MSTFAYAALTTNRLRTAAAPGLSEAAKNEITAAASDAAQQAGADQGAALATGAAVAAGAAAAKPTAAGLGTFIDAMAALVPAEVLVAHGAIVALATKVSATKAHGINSTVITERGWLQFAFYALVVFAALLYLGGRLVTDRSIKPLDWLRALIPASAFVLWTMLQKATAFDAVAPSFSTSGNGAARSIVATIAALFVGGAAVALGYQANKAN